MQNCSLAMNKATKMFALEKRKGITRSHLEKNEKL